MTYTYAKLVIWNHRAYPCDTVRRAAIFILGCLDAHLEDIHQASMVI